MKINKVTTKFEGEHNGIQFEFTIASLFYLCDQPIHLMQDIDDSSANKDTISAVYNSYIENKNIITKSIEDNAKAINTIPANHVSIDILGDVVEDEFL